jgi:hypothetical protein
MFGPEVSIRGGNHTTTILGRYMVGIRENEKRLEDELGVIIEDDVWAGTRSIVLNASGLRRAMALSPEERVVMRHKAKMRAEVSFDYRNWSEPLGEFMRKVISTHQSHKQ